MALDGILMTNTLYTNSRIDVTCVTRSTGLPIVCKTTSMCITKGGRVVVLQLPLPLPLLLREVLVVIIIIVVVQAVPLAMIATLKAMVG